MERLEQLMIDDPGARSEYCRQVDIHLGLRSLAKVRPIAEIQVPPISSVLSPEAASLWWLPRLMFAAIVLVVVGWFSGRFAAPFQDVAIMSDAANQVDVAPSITMKQLYSAEFLGDRAPKAGSNLAIAHKYILIQGAVELAFPNGAEVILESPAIFSIEALDRLALESGHCSVHAPDGAEGFRVETPLAKVVDLGTRFEVNVSSSGDTKVQVVEGEAEVSGRADDMQQQKPVLLHANHAMEFYAETQLSPKRVSFDGKDYRYGLPDRVLTYDVEETADGKARDLKSVSVQRGGKPYRYAIEDLIPTAVTHYRSTGSDRLLTVAYRVDDPDPISSATELDNALNTGILNPGGSVEPLRVDPTATTPGMGLRFIRPIVNSAGPDFVLFELQSIVNPLKGDAFHIGPTKFRPGLRSITVREFQLTMSSPEVKEVASFGLLRHVDPVESLADLKKRPYVVMHKHSNFRAIAVAVDLSDLGYEEGESVQELFLQDAMDSENDYESVIDPVFIGGFPPVRRAGL